MHFYCTFISPSAVTHLLRIPSKHGVYGFDPLEQVGWDHVGDSVKWQNTVCLMSFVIDGYHNQKSSGMQSL